MHRGFAGVVDLLWALFAATLIGAAAAVTVARVLLPEISTQRDAITAWIATTIGRPATVGAIDASWSGWAPRISVDGIALLDVGADAEIVRFERATLNIAPLESIRAGALKPRSLVLSGVALTLIRHADGHFSVAGMPPPKSPVIQWLLQQDNFTVTEADLTIVDEAAQQRFALSGLSLTIRDRDGRKVLAAQVELPPAIGGRLYIEFDARGDPLGSDWDGTVNFRLDGVHSRYLVEQLEWAGPPPQEATLDITGWTEWRGGSLRTARFALNALAATGAAAIKATVLSAQGRLTRRTRGWRLEVVDLALPQLPQSTASARFTAAWHSESGLIQAIAVRARDVPLEPLAALAAALVPALDSRAEALGALRLSGALGELEGAWHRSDTAPRYCADLTLTHVSSRRYERLPGITGLDASIYVRREGAAVRFAGDDFKLADDVRLVETLDFSELDGLVVWRSGGATNGRPQIDIPRLSGDVEGARFSISGTLDHPADASRTAALTIGLAELDGVRVHHLLPRGLLPPRGEAWLRQVIQAGTLHDGRVVLRGPLAAFPFRAAEGVFAADFEVADADLAYSQRWPVALALDGHLALRDAAVRLQVAQARVRNADIVGADIEVPDLFTRERMVHISGTARGPGMSASDIIMASPLKGGKAARVAELDITGELEVQLDMDLALFPGGPREVLGQARFSGNRIAARKLNIVLDDVIGTVSFTRDDWYGEGLTARFENTPVGLVFNGGLDDPNYDSEFRMTGTSPAPLVVDYLERFAPPLHRWLAQRQALSALDGELPWKAVLTIPSASTGATQLPQRLRLESSLQGLAIELPWPLGKQREATLPLAVDIALSGGFALATRLHLGDILAAEIAAQRDADGNAAIERIEVVFGSRDPRFSGAPGITLAGYLAQLPLSEWNRLNARAAAPAGKPGAELPLSFDVEIGELSLFEQRFEDMRLRGTREATLWEVSATSSATSGTLRIPRDLAHATLRLDFERLHLAHRASSGGEDAATSLDPRRFPALELRAQAFRYGDIELGQAEILTARRDSGLTLEKLRFAADDFSLSATGDWLADGDLHSSHFDIDVASDTLAALLQRFGYSVANIEGGKTAISIDARWSGAPTAFSLARIAGNFELHVEPGRLLDVDPGGGRVFGLLSLQTLPRRLSLDFDDLFGKGFAFDHIDGLFILEGGNAYTNSLVMEGPSARIDVSGRAGLAARDYDQRVTVTPALSSSIPMAGALFGPIGLGAGAVVYLGQKMFKSIPEQIDRFLSREYSVTGAWDNPTIERL